VLACAALTVPGCASGPPSAAGQRSRLPRAAPLGTVASPPGTGVLLARLDPVTLQPREPQRFFGEYHRAARLSPDGTQLAVAVSEFAKGQVGAEIVDTRTLEITGRVSTGVAAEALAWLEPRRVAALLQGHTAVLIDPARASVIRRVLIRSGRQCGESHPPSAATRHALVVLVGQRLAAMDARGRVRAASLAGAAAECAGAGFAVDRGERHAYVVASRGRAAAIDLRTMRVERHRLRGPRPRRGGRTDVQWVGGGILAAAHSTRGGDPRGVELVDTRSWSRRTLQRRAGGARPAAGRVLVFDGGLRPRRGLGMGVRAYDRSGRQRLHLLGRESIQNVQVAGRFAYAIGPKGLRVIDIRAGKVVSRSADAPANVAFITGAER
jgi:hypothetical protein